MRRGEFKLMMYGIGFGYLAIHSFYILAFKGVDTQEEYDRM